MRSRRPLRHRRPRHRPRPHQLRLRAREVHLHLRRRHRGLRSSSQTAAGARTTRPQTAEATPTTGQLSLTCHRSGPRRTAGATAKMIGLLRGPKMTKMTKMRSGEIGELHSRRPATRSSRAGRAALAGAAATLWGGSPGRHRTTAVVGTIKAAGKARAPMAELQHRRPLGDADMTMRTKARRGSVHAWVPLRAGGCQHVDKGSESGSASGSARCATKT